MPMVKSYIGRVQRSLNGLSVNLYDGGRQPCLGQY